MTRLRSLLLGRRWLALAVVVLALAVRIGVPAGMMPGYGPHGATLVVCSGEMAMPAMPGMTMPGMSVPKSVAGRPDPARPDPAKADAPCAYTGLLAAALDTADLPVVTRPALAVAVATVAALPTVAPRALRLRPPLRGPPEQPAG